MLRGLKPDMICRDVYAIDVGKLKSMGVQALMFDLDNTLAPWNDCHITHELADWVADCRLKGMAMCICSNNHAPRVRPVADALGMEFIADAGKPAAGAYERVCRCLDKPRERIAAVGDQLITDVFGAKRNGMKAVLVNPMGRREFMGTYFNRLLERLLMPLMGISRAR